jgi:glutathione S-transferase
MTDTGLELYHGLPSTCSKKVRLVLYEKGLAFRSHLMDLRKFEQHRPEYLKLNPNGVVPTLIHDGQIVVESSIIMEYLDDAFPQIPLRPRDALGRALVRRWLKFSDDVGYQAVYAPTWMILNRDAMKNLSPSEREQVLARIPSSERRKRWLDVTANGFAPEVLEKAAEQKRFCIAHCEAALSGSPWLAGPQLSLADFAVLPFIDRIRNLRPEWLEPPLFPHLNAWYRRLEMRPAFAKAIDFQDDPRVAEMINI